jgi:hypothetical protein
MNQSAVLSGKRGFTDRVAGLICKALTISVYFWMPASSMAAIRFAVAATIRKEREDGDRREIGLPQNRDL